MTEQDFVFRNQKPLISRKVGMLWLEQTKHSGQPKINILIDKLKGTAKLRLFALQSKGNKSEFIIYRIRDEDIFDENHVDNKIAKSKQPLF